MKAHLQPFAVMERYTCDLGHREERGLGKCTINCSACAESEDMGEQDLSRIFAPSFGCGYALRAVGMR